MYIDYLHYDDAIFDAHTHVIDIEALKELVKIEEQYGVEKTLVIVHGDSIESYRKLFPDRFLYARYFSGWTLFTQGPDEAIAEIPTLRENGYSMAKMHFAPFWSDRLSDIEGVPSIDSPHFDTFFDNLADEDIPVLVHIGDPDTYFATRYTDSKVYGTKDNHIEEFSNRLARTPSGQFQAAHFAAQPERHRIGNLGRMFDEHSNLFVDMSSARWMCRELGKDPAHSREFLIKYSNRILFATDCVASNSRASTENYFIGRHASLRLMLESDVRNIPLPFVDQDTVNTGGTFINGLDLPDKVLRKIYWDNAMRFHKIS